MRGSNVTRDYHLRGVELLQDGIPINYADGGGDFYQIDPRYYREIEVLKGGNALSAVRQCLAARSISSRRPPIPRFRLIICD